MENNDIIRFLSGLKKKHGDDFSLVIKYVTDSGKIRKRGGVFKELREDGTLVLFNSQKNSEGQYCLERIQAIEKG